MRIPLPVGGRLGLGCGGLFALVFLLVAGGMAYKSISLVIGGEKADGRVARHEIKTSEDSDGGTKRTRYPIIAFTTKGGEDVEFQGVGGSGVPPVGADVVVLYDPKNPKSASVDSFVDLWLFPLLFGAFGLFTLASMVINHRKAKKIARLQSGGIAVDATITAVKRHQAFASFYWSSDKSESKHGWDVEATWTDPASGQTRTFKGLSLWVNPEIAGMTTVKVFIDPQDASRYHMDFPNPFGRLADALSKGFGGRPPEQTTFTAAATSAPAAANPNAVMPNATAALFGGVAATPPAAAPPPAAPVPPELAAYVASAKAQGHDAASLRQTLLASGWNATDVDNALK